jgi:hypothetical protein
VLVRSSSVRGVFGGGYTGSGSNVIQYITIASTGNATDFGDLTVARDSLGSTSNDTRGIFGGGGEANQIDFITIASTGNATDYGDLVNAVNTPKATSNGHGGLS